MRETIENVSNSYELIRREIMNLQNFNGSESEIREKFKNLKNQIDELLTFLDMKTIKTISQESPCYNNKLNNDNQKKFYKNMHFLYMCNNNMMHEIFTNLLQIQYKKFEFEDKILELCIEPYIVLDLKPINKKENIFFSRIEKLLKENNKDQNIFTKSLVDSDQHIFLKSMFDFDQHIFSEFVNHFDIENIKASERMLEHKTILERALNHNQQTLDIDLEKKINIVINYENKINKLLDSSEKYQEIISKYKKNFKNKEIVSLKNELEVFKSDILSIQNRIIILIENMHDFDKNNKQYETIIAQSKNFIDKNINLKELIKNIGQQYNLAIITTFNEMEEDNIIEIFLKIMHESNEIVVYQRKNQEVIYNTAEQAKTKEISQKNFIFKFIINNYVILTVLFLVLVVTNIVMFIWMIMIKN